MQDRQHREAMTNSFAAILPKSISTKRQPEKHFKENSSRQNYFCKGNNSTKVNFNKKAIQRK